MRVLNYISAFILAVLFLPGMCTEQIDPGQIGVRRSIEGGVAEQDFGVGKHWSLPLFHSWYQLDGTLKYMEFVGDKGSAIDVRTTNNNIIYMDITVPYRIRPEKGWDLVQSGLINDYTQRVRTTIMSIMPKELSSLSTEDVQDPDKRIKAAEDALPVLNKALEPYHVEATHVVVRAFRFRKQLEQQLQKQQQFVVDGKLDSARKSESEAQQKTETIEKRIDKTVALKREEWNKKIEQIKAKYELEIGKINAKATVYSKKTKAAADAQYAEYEAEGKLAMAKAQALGQKLKAEALASKAGRTFSAIEAVRTFELGDIQLNSYDPKFLREFASMDAWRKFFLPSE